MSDSLSVFGGGSRISGFGEINFFFHIYLFRNWQNEPRVQCSPCLFICHFHPLQIWLSGDNRRITYEISIFINAMPLTTVHRSYLVMIGMVCLAGMTPLYFGNLQLTEFWCLLKEQNLFLLPMFKFPHYTSCLKRGRFLVSMVSVLLSDIQPLILF